MRKIVLLGCALALLSTACWRPGNRPGRTTTTRPGPRTTLPAGTGDCDRACLTGAMDQYLDAMVAHDPSRLPLAAGVRFTEDNTVKELPASTAWRNATRLRSYRQDVIDPYAGVAGTHVVIEEGNAPALLLVRLRLVNRQITEIEQFAVHNSSEGTIFSPDNLQAPSPAMTLVPSADQRESRDEAIRLAEYYPRGLQAGSFVTIDAPFAPDAYRLENGTRMAGPGCVMVTLGCQNIKTQGIPRLAGITWRVPAVDEELGIVWIAMKFYDQGAGRSFFVWEQFKVYGGQIHAVEAFMKIMPTGPVW